MATRALGLQRVIGDADKAETSFFKINTQGTPLDEIEETLLRNRSRSVPISARAIFRAASGHKYWSKFDTERQITIEETAQSVNRLLFHPEVDEPIKTLDLPLGGASSALAALDLLSRLIRIAHVSQEGAIPSIDASTEDSSGEETIKVLKKTERVVSWLTGNAAQSLGLHPAVWFYTEKGKHNSDLLLGLVLLVAQKLAQNQKQFFKIFSQVRGRLEEGWLKEKSLIVALLQTFRSGARIEKVAFLVNGLVDELAKNPRLKIRAQLLIRLLNPPTSKVISIKSREAGRQVSDETKSSVFIREALARAQRCPICLGYIEPSQSASYDHIKRESEGGLGDENNVQITHPFCNTGVKN